MDPSGEYLDRGGLYTSSDFGDSWNFKLAGDFWYSSIACSANGSIAVAANGEAGIYVSYDSGDTWTLSSAKDGYGNFWVTVTINDPGQYLAAGTWASGIYVSFDYGVTWETTNAPIRYYWISLTSDATGRLLAAGYLTSDVSLEFDSDANFGYIYTSSNYGVSWTSSKAPPDDWISIVSSFNGRNLVARSRRGVRDVLFQRFWHVSPGREVNYRKTGAHPAYLPNFQSRASQIRMREGDKASSINFQ